VLQKLQCVAACTTSAPVCYCNVMQCVAVCCSLLQFVAVCCRVECVAVHPYTAVALVKMRVCCCSVLQCSVAVCCSVRVCLSCVCV